jgi:hypothetical protein
MDWDGNQTAEVEMRQIAEWLERGEMVLYAIAGVMLAAVALVILIHAAVAFVGDLGDGDIVAAVVHLLEQLLLALMAVELLYTVTVSIRTHSLSPEPFLIVGLVAAVRRILTLSVEASEYLSRDPEHFKLALYEIGLLTVGVLVLVFSIHILRRGRKSADSA